MSDLAAHAAHPAGFAHQFEDMDQQHAAGNLGMWVFLITEIMFFGGLFAGYIIYRALYLPAFETGSRLLNVNLGATNTAVLIASSLTMALAIQAAQAGKSKGTMIFYLILTMILGATFLGVKFIFEWRHDYVEGLVPGINFIVQPEHWGPMASQVQMFFCFYFFMTGLHALHMIVGIGILTVLVVMAARGRFTEQYFFPLEISGLYWHFVDIVWIFLFPLLYLIGGTFVMKGGH
ncbi:MAG TPA: cytochrome c oxidase subunit 3 family protein [Candidatus Sulfotelmatobacter sp.]|nr:cytochrome c oxidase subunit 3 family protein [Candidatus Sulfotelmatobacter sp.]